MDEIEVKIIEIDAPAVIKKIEALGAKKAFDGEVVSVFFDKPGDALQKDKQVFRLRTLGDKTLLTWKSKGSKTDVKLFDEVEFSLDDVEAAKRMLIGLGFIIVEEDRKRRTSYKKGKISYEIEYREGIPPYLEVEAHSKKELIEALKELGYDLADTKPWSGSDVLRHYGKKTKFKI
jgi:adenylate cyclase class 2